MPKIHSYHSWEDVVRMHPNFRCTCRCRDHKFPAALVDTFKSSRLPADPVTGEARHEPHLVFEAKCLPPALHRDGCEMLLLAAAWRRTVATYYVPDPSSVEVEGSEEGFISPNEPLPWEVEA